MSPSKHLVQLRGPRRAHTQRDGFTLLEVLVATAVTLLMMVSLAQVFKVIGDSMKQGRAALELNSRLRNVAHRIQLDLNNATVAPKPGNDAVTGSGYMKIYDGPLTDYSYANELASANRFGDVDDIIMFTARAGDDWFTGKVPLYVLQNASIPAGGTPIPIDADNSQLVTITAQHAEIVIFAEPLVTNENNADRNSAYLIMNPADNYAKLLDPATSAPTDLPSSYRLYYRTLLIRPDLNMSIGAYAGTLASSLIPGSLTNNLIARRGAARYPSSAAAINLPWPTCDMALAHQQCDLSMRRVDQFPASPAASSALAANSLEDLANPANRFAHVQIPLSDDPNPDFSMPILALSPKLQMPNTNITTAEPGANLDALSSPMALESRFNYQSGFLHPAFTLTNDRTGEDVLASDVLAFDVKAYDSGATLYAHPGADLFPGVATVDDDGAGGTDDAGEYLWRNSDDLIVTPNDPGYNIGMATTVAVATGDFVDIGWGRKAQTHWNVFGVGQLSGISPTAGATGAPFEDSLYRSGLVVQSGAIAVNAKVYSSSLIIHQPSYDTWYSGYEGDGALQCEIGGTGIRGAVRVNLAGGSVPKEAWRANSGSPVIDAGTDGIDNALSPTGVDDLSERETSAPFPVDLRGVKISIRMEDPAARQFNQMSIIKEFVTQ